MSNGGGRDKRIRARRWRRAAAAAAPNFRLKLARDDDAASTFSTRADDDTCKCRAVAHFSYASRACAVLTRHRRKANFPGISENAVYALYVQTYSNIAEFEYMYIYFIYLRLPSLFVISASEGRSRQEDA